MRAPRPGTWPAPRGRRLSRTPLALLALLAATLAGIAPHAARPAVAQERDEEARLPARGELWIEVHPSFESWHEQFARSSPTGGVEDGEPEPLTADFDGPVAARLFPGLAPLLADVNADAAALGFAPLAVGDVSLGSLTIGALDAEVRRIPFAVRYGVLDRLALEVFAPVVRNELETSFRFDSLSASLIDARSAIPDAATFFPSLDASLAELRALADDGTLTPEQEATARALLESAGAFSSALSRRVDAGGLVPHGGTPAGAQIAARYAELEAGFGSFGLGLPALAFPTLATSADFQRYLTGAPVGAAPFGGRVRSYAIGEIEIGARLGVLDTFGRPARRPAPEEAAPHPDTAVAPADSAAAPARDPAAAPAPDSAAPPAPDSAAALVPDSAAPPGNAARATPRAPADTALPYPGGIRLRTTIGVRLKLPLRDADRSPFRAPADFLGVPIGEGHRAVEISVYQDVGLGPRLFVAAVLRRGFQLSRELRVRVAPPDRPFALASTLAAVERDPGDTWSLRLAPRLVVSDVLSFGLEYSWWRKGADAYAAVGAGADPDSADPLEVETEETRHRLGIGVFYRTTDRVRAGVARLPVELHLVFQTAFAGSGGQTPVSSLISTGIRVPLRLF